MGIRLTRPAQPNPLQHLFTLLCFAPLCSAQFCAAQLCRFALRHSTLHRSTMCRFALICAAPQSAEPLCPAPLYAIHSAPLDFEPRRSALITYACTTAPASCVRMHGCNRLLRTHAQLHLYVRYACTVEHACCVHMHDNT